jgi:hypothetical protein
MQITYSDALKNAIRILGNRLSIEERRMLIEIVGFAFAEGKIAGKEQILIDCEEKEKKSHEQKPKEETSTSD